MTDLKHVGRHVTSRKKCVVAYRVVPHAADYCLVVNSESLDAEQHDSLMRLIESNAGQSAYELAEAMQRTRLPDGRNMLQAFHTQGKLVKTLTKDVEMIPNQRTNINLSDLNKIVAEQRGVSVKDLALGLTNKQEKAKHLAENPEVAEDPVAVTDPAAAYAEEGLLTDEKLAAQYRSQADSMYKEAKSLCDQADKLDPPKKVVAPKATSKTAKPTTPRSKKATTSG
jgi:hypothetical protein